MQPIGGMVNSRTFFAGLAYRKFFATQYLRHHSSLFYSPEPDMVHDMMGHAPLLGNEDIANIY